jgi:hypothetical protein
MRDPYRDIPLAGFAEGDFLREGSILIGKKQ